jgi:hypothetical protein
MSSRLKSDHLVTVAAVALALVLALPLTATAAGKPKADNLKNLPHLVVFDANGQKVGEVSSLSSQIGVRVDFRFGPYLFWVDVNPLGFGPGYWVSYESIDCTGQGWMEFFTNSFVQPAALLDPGHTVYVADPSATPVTVQTKSITDPIAGCERRDNIFQGVPAVAVVNLDDYFTPPFTVK